MLGFRVIQTHLHLSNDGPPNAATGIEGIRTANKILRSYGVPGILIGGLAKEIWSGKTSDEVLSEHKDIDVVVLSFDCRQHPDQWEGGIDWWISHSPEERLTNGSRVGLRWMMVSLDDELEPGLYLCPSDLLTEIMGTERRIRGRRNDHYRFKASSPTLTFDDIRLLPDHLVHARRFENGRQTPKSVHCKPY